MFRSVSVSCLRRDFFEGELSSSSLSLAFFRFLGVIGGSLLSVVFAALSVTSFCLKEGVRFRPEVRGDFSDPVGDGGLESWMVSPRSLILRVKGGGADDFPRDADTVDGFGWLLPVPGGVRSTGIQRIGD